MKEIAENLYVKKKCVTSYGTRGKCSFCQRAPKQTAEINGYRYCKVCVNAKFPNHSAVNLEETDARFRCYASNAGKGCGADQLSYREYYVGTCCENAAKTTAVHLKFERASVLHEIYKDVRKEEGAAEEKAEEAGEKVEEAKKALEMAEAEAENAREDLSIIRTFRKKVQKRSLFLTKDAMKEDNSDIESSDEAEDNYEEYEKAKCKVCFELFGDEHPEALVIPCGHRACFKCLSSLPQKTCPSCRAEFTDGKIFKIY